MQAHHLQPTVAAVGHAPGGVEHRLARLLDQRLVERCAASRRARRLAEPRGRAPPGAGAGRLAGRCCGRRAGVARRVTRHVIASESAMPMNDFRQLVATAPRRAAAVAAAGDACSPTVSTHGTRSTRTDLAQIQPGVTSREEVERLLGSPVHDRHVRQGALVLREPAQRGQCPSTRPTSRSRMWCASTSTPTGSSATCTTHGLEMAQASSPIPTRPARWATSSARPAVPRQYRPLQLRPARDPAAGKPPGGR